MNQVDIPVAIAEDHPMTRNAIKSILSETEGYYVSLEAADGKDLISKLEQSDQPPTILILDIGMPRMNGYDTMAVLRVKYPSIFVLILTMFSEEYSIVQMFRLGAKGYLEKGRADQLPQALKVVQDGNLYFNDGISGNLIPRMQRRERPVGFTEKEKQILQLFCSDQNYQEIADNLGITVRTVQGYRESLFQKLDVTTRAGLVLTALRTGLVPLNDIQEPDDPS